MQHTRVCVSLHNFAGTAHICVNIFVRVKMCLFAFVFGCVCVLICVFLCAYVYVHDVYISRVRINLCAFIVCTVYVSVRVNMCVHTLPTLKVSQHQHCYPVQLNSLAYLLLPD